MTGWNGRWPPPVLLVVSMLAATGALAQSDAPGSSDPAGLSRFPGAWIIEYSPETGVRSFEFITGQVARIRREVRIESSMRTAARLSRVTYRTPNGTRLDDVVDYYEDIIDGLGGREQFTCRGQGCGHSTIWANQIFGIKELAAPDGAQFYLATTIEGSALGLPDSGTEAWVSVYVVQRPNRRVNAHLDFAIVTPESSGNSAEDIVKLLNSRGFAVIEAAAPNISGALDDDALAALDDLAPALGPFADRIVVVCHLGSDVDPENARQVSETCAETGSARLGAAGVQAGAFGAGAFLPREGAPPDRLELVVPGAKQSR